MRGTPAHAQRGLALIIAMLVAALAAAVTVSLSAAQAQWTAQVANRRDKIQAQSIALAGIAWTRQILDVDGRTTIIDHPGEPWALPLPATPVDNGSVAGRIVDAQSLLNANNLRDGPHVAAERGRFERLFASQRLQPALLDLLAERDESGTPLERYQRAHFVVGPVYGTRCSTVMLVDLGGRVTFAERSFDTAGARVADVREAFQIERAI